MGEDQLQRYHRAVHWIQSFHRPSTRFIIDRRNPQRYIDRMKLLCEQLANPQRSFRVIHVAGTAGKGTVSSMLANILAAAGQRTGLYTSPYCITPIENIAVDGQYISPAQFVGIARRLKTAVIDLRSSAYGPPSTFELMTAMALLYFRNQGCDWAVLETGLGGTYDATNVVDHPIVCVITTIGLDHTQVLGGTVQEIARDKAGIIKPGAHVFTNASQQSVIELLRNRSLEAHAQFHAPQQPSTNAHLAGRVGTFLGLANTAIRNGIARTRLPCRQEWVEPTIMLDGAHSPIKMRYLCSHLPQRAPATRRIAVVGIADDKDKKGILRALIPHIDTLIATPFRITGWGRRRCATAAELAAIAHRIRPGMELHEESQPISALKKARRLWRAGDIIMVTGSFYLAGFLRRQWYSERGILRRRISF